MHPRRECHRLTLQVVIPAFSTSHKFKKKFSDRLLQQRGAVQMGLASYAFTMALHPAAVKLRLFNLAFDSLQKCNPDESHSPLHVYRAQSLL